MARESEARQPAGASSLVEVDLAALSDPGKVRRRNEDHYIAARFDRTMRTLLTNLPEGEVPSHYAETAYGLLVADGVGGSAWRPGEDNVTVVLGRYRIPEDTQTLGA